MLYVIYPEFWMILKNWKVYLVIWKFKKYI